MPVRTNAQRTAASVPQKVAVDMASVWGDPEQFVRRVLGVTLWEKQVEIYDAVMRHRKVAIKGCHASSKTFSMGGLIAWWCMRWPDAVAIVTAPTATQARHGTWKELKKAVELAQRYVDVPTPGDFEWKLKGEENCAFIRATTSRAHGVQFQAPHSAHVLIVVDEAPGVDAGIFEAIEGIRAGGDVRLVIMGNPTVPSGKFYDAFTRDRASWKTITVDGLNTPNMRGVTLADLAAMPLDEGGPLDQNECPWLITRRWVREKLDDWGETNPRFESRVLGRFPQQAEGALVPLAWLEQAKWAEVKRSGGRVSAGIDVAEAGEAESVLYVLDRGHVVAAPTCTAAADSRGEIARGLAPWRDVMGTVRYDSVGVGAYFGPHLRDLGYRCAGVNVGRASTKPKEFVRYRDQAFWEVREQFRQGNIAGLEDELTIAQLASLQYQARPDGRIAVQSKKDIVKSGGRSPDRADALMLAVSSGIQMGSGAAVPMVVPQVPITERELVL